MREEHPFALGNLSLRHVLLRIFVLALFFPAWSITNAFGGGIQLSTLLIGAIMIVALYERYAGKWMPGLKLSVWLIGIFFLLALILMLQTYTVPFGVFSENPWSKTLKQATYLVAGIAIFVLTDYLVRSPRDIHIVVQMLSIGGWLALLYALGELMFYWNIVPWFVGIDQLLRSNPSYEYSITEILFGWVPRLHSFAPEQSIAGVLLIFPAALAFAAALTTPRRAAIALAFGLNGLYVLTFSRVASLMLLVTLAFIFVIAILRAPANAFRLALIFALIASVHLAVIGLSSMERAQLFPSPYGVDLSAYTRAVEQAIALDVWNDHPFGTGWGLWGYYFPTRVEWYFAPGAFELWNFAFANSASWVPINNTYLRILTELGIFGLVVFIALIGLLAIKALQALCCLNDAPDAFIVIGIAGGLLGMLIGGFLTELMSFGMFWFALALSEHVFDQARAIT